MSGISTHVLDTASGKPAANIRVQLFRHDEELGTAFTDAAGRCRALLPEGMVLMAGTYRLTFDIGAQFPNAFYPEITISFRVADASEHYHVPLLLSPFGFTTYKGSN
jgi:5-hydroxyisourate hydrolase